MKKVLQLLDKNLSGLRPEYYAALNPPLGELEMDSPQKKYNTTLPSKLKDLYKWKNGQAANCYDSFINNCVFMPLEAAKECTSMIGNDFDIKDWWNASWLPIFHSGGGDYIFFDASGIFTGSPGQLIEFWHADNNRNVIAPNPEAFMTALTNYYNTTLITDF